MIRPLVLAAALWSVAHAANAGCGSDEAACEIENGIYDIELPDDDNPPLVIFLHGYGGNGANVMKNRGMIDTILARGYAFAAPSGERRVGEGAGRSWNFYPGWEGRDETGFLQDVVADAAKRFDVNPDRVILSGFSAGGFMVYYSACDTPDAFSAYAPVSGGFWRPHPESCKGPIRMFHTHGWTDNVVPLEGRVLGGGRFLQGDIFAGLEIWREANGCIDHKPSGFSTTGAFMRRRWIDCDSDGMLEFALFPGGHTIPSGWADMVLDWYEDLPSS